MRLQFLAALAAIVPTFGAPPPIDARVSALLAQMTPEEQIAQLFYTGWPTKDPAALLKLMPHGIGGMSLNDLTSRNAIQAAYMSNATRLQIPVSFYAESLRSGGVTNATIFPMPQLLGSTWNLSLAHAIGRVVASELYAMGGDRSFSPVLQVTTDPRYGRFDENFGECELTLSDSGLHSIAPSGESKFHWASVDRTLLTDTYLFIFLNGPIGYPIPISEIGRDSALAAYKYVTQHIETKD